MRPNQLAAKTKMAAALTCAIKKRACKRIGFIKINSENQLDANACPSRKFSLIPARMKDLTSAAWIKFKGLLFLLLGIAAATLLILEHPTAKAILLLAVTVWCFCRAYYFAFYVIEKYVDPSYKFSGLLSFAKYMMRRRGKIS